MPVGGETMLKFLETASPEQRWRMSQSLVEFLHIAITKGRMVYCDFHWGNMRVENGHLVMLDFGMVEILTQAETEVTCKMFYYAITNQYQEYEKLIRQRYPKLLPYITAQYAIHAHLAAPYQTTAFVFTASYLEKVHLLMSTYEGDTTDSGWSFTRAYIMLASILVHIGASVNFQSHVASLRGVLVGL